MTAAQLLRAELRNARIEMVAGLMFAGWGVWASLNRTWINVLYVFVGASWFAVSRLHARMANLRHSRLLRVEHLEREVSREQARREQPWDALGED